MTEIVGSNAQTPGAMPSPSSLVSSFNSLTVSVTSADPTNDYWVASATTFFTGTWAWPIRFSANTVTTTGSVINTTSIFWAVDNSAAVANSFKVYTAYNQATHAVSGLVDVTATGTATILAYTPFLIKHGHAATGNTGTNVAFQVVTSGGSKLFEIVLSDPLGTPANSPAARVYGMKAVVTPNVFFNHPVGLYGNVNPPSLEMGDNQNGTGLRISGGTLAPDIALSSTASTSGSPSTLTVTGHPLPTTATPIVFTAQGGGLSPAVTLNTTTYYAKKIDANNIAVYTDFAMTSQVAFTTNASATSSFWVQNHPSGAKVGDWYLRRDTPSTSNQRIYVCTVAGTPGTWAVTLA